MRFKIEDILMILPALMVLGFLFYALHAVFEAMAKVGGAF